MGKQTMTATSTTQRESQEHIEKESQILEAFRSKNQFNRYVKIHKHYVTVTRLTKQDGE